MEAKRAGSPFVPSNWRVRKGSGIPGSSIHVIPSAHPLPAPYEPNLRILACLSIRVSQPIELRLGPLM